MDMTSAPQLQCSSGARVQTLKLGYNDLSKSLLLHVTQITVPQFLRHHVNSIQEMTAHRVLRHDTFQGKCYGNLMDEQNFSMSSHPHNDKYERSKKEAQRGLLPKVPASLHGNGSHLNYWSIVMYQSSLIRYLRSIVKNFFPAGERSTALPRNDLPENARKELYAVPLFSGLKHHAAPLLAGDRDLLVCEYIRAGVYKSVARPVWRGVVPISEKRMRHRMRCPARCSRCLAFFRYKPCDESGDTVLSGRRLNQKEWDNYSTAALDLGAQKYILHFDDGASPRQPTTGAC
ncbi:hypothetical protein TNCV_1004901 [Trichonephila clavipes]|nr:hypothetical protein TNCV_1004901 [Trichonephila clavipes]